MNVVCDLVTSQEWPSGQSLSPSRALVNDGNQVAHNHKPARNQTQLWTGAWLGGDWPVTGFVVTSYA